MDSELQQALAQFEGRLNARIDGVESRLTAHIDAIENGLNLRIDGAESRLTATSMRSRAVSTRASIRLKLD